MRRVAVSTSVALLLLFLGGCGGSDGDDSADAQPYIDALVEDMTTADDDSDFVLEDDDADCLATELVDIVGMDAIEESDATPEAFGEADSFSALDIDLDADDEEAMAAAFNDCLADDAFFALFAEQIGVDEIPDSCTEYFGTETWAPTFAASLVGGSEGDPVNELLAAVPGACAERLMFSAAVADGSLTMEQADCVADQLDDDDAEAIWRAILADSEGWTTTNPELAATLETTRTACA